jgi:monoamine oxidase
VLVIGAGIAGLVAARELAADGSQVTVVERMPRVGGRARVDDSLGVTVPLGGAWLHGVEGHPLRDLVAHRPDEWAYDHTVVVDHGWVAEPDLDAARAIRSDLLARLERAGELPNDTSVAGLVDTVLADHAAASPLARQVARRWIVNVFESLYAAPLDDISAAAGLEEYELPGGDHFITGNLQQALERLADGLDIRLGHRVATLGRRDGAWHTDTGLTADAVVVTIPIGALRAQRITFDPPLPPPVRDAIDHLGAGPVTKVFATYDQRWWPTAFRTTRVAGADAPFVMAVDVSDVAGRPTLCWFAVGDLARRLESMSEDELCTVVDDTARRSRLFDPPEEAR